MSKQEDDSNLLIQDNSFSSDEEDFQDSDEEDENEDEEDENGTKRPGTSRYKHNKNLQMSQDAKNHVKKLRQLQFENRNVVDDHINDIDLNLKTAIVNPKARNGCSEGSDLDTDDDEENAFCSNRNVSTVKVNGKRKSLEPLSLNINNGNGANESTKSSDDNTDLKMRRCGGDNVVESEKIEANKVNRSEREVRLAEMVNQMKQKQVEHEQKQLRKQSGHFFNQDLNPLFIGGGIFLGGLLLHQLYKIYFSSR
jgi:hypothetical protein